jgi:hypothetical protein
MKTMIMILGMTFLVSGSAIVAGEKCVNCSSSSSCNQCRLGSKDTSAGRKRCEKMGCKITGTGSCSTASNVRVCG